MTSNINSKSSSEKLWFEDSRFNPQWLHIAIDNTTKKLSNIYRLSRFVFLKKKLELVRGINYEIK